MVDVYVGTSTSTSYVDEAFNMPGHETKWLR